MSSTSPLQCLFCKHSNAPDVIFCSACDAQLDLQPCEQCGAVDSRAAKRCHKCGSEFATVPESELGAEAEPVQQIAVITPSEMGATTTGSRRRWLFFGVPLLLSLIAVSVYVMRIQPAKLPQQKQATQPRPVVLNGIAPSTVAAQVQSAEKPTEIQSTPLVGTDRLHSLSSVVPTGARATLTKHSGPAKIEETGTLRSSPPLKECPQEVATLGLCNPEINKEKQPNE